MHAVEPSDEAEVASLWRVKCSQRVSMQVISKNHGNELRLKSSAFDIGRTKKYWEDTKKLRNGRSNGRVASYGNGANEGRK